MSLPRERLTALLAESALTSVELVIAPPGFGKTTLLREYAAADGGAVFIALPEGADLEAFVRTVIGAVEPPAVHSIGALFANGDQRGLEDRVGTWLASRLRIFDGTLIVDDFHRTAGDERVARVLVAAIAATHGRIRWIVSSRESPAFPMGSWIARGWMGLPVTGEDLCFTAEEARHLATSLDVAVSRAAIDAIVDETLGWPIGVRLALTLVARKRGIGSTRVQTREALFALLDDEVWKPLDRTLRELVSAAALMPAPAIGTLEAAGFPDARAGMLRVFTKIPFVQPIDDDAFAIHDLFREFVATFVSRTPSARAGAAARMGTALLASGNPADGIGLLIEADNVTGVADALGMHAFDFLETGRRSIVTTAVAFLTDHGLGDSGIVLAIRGALAFADGSAANSMNLFARALQRDMPQPVRSEVSRKLAISYANRGQLSEALDILQPLESDAAISPEERLEVAAMTISYLAAAGLRERTELLARISDVERQVATVRPAAQVRLLQRLGNAAFYTADYERAERLSQDAALLATDLGMDTVAALAYGTLLSVAYNIDPDLTRALSFSQSQEAAAERAANTALRVYALRIQYLIAAQDVDVERAAAIESTLTSLVDSNSYRDNYSFRIARAVQYAAIGNMGKAEATLRTLASGSLSGPRRVRVEELHLLLALLRGKRSEVSSALDRTLLSEAPHDFDGRIQMSRAYCYRGLAYWILDRPAQARRTFEFNIADLPQRDRILVEAFQAVSALPHPVPNSNVIDPIYRTLAAAGYRAYAELLRRLVEADANDVELSAAELETLREFDRFGGRAVDVAKALGKSKFTVQNQIQSAIRKLGCSGRAEALAYARQRGWLDRASN